MRKSAFDAPPRALSNAPFRVAGRSAARSGLASPHERPRSRPISTLPRSCAKTTERNPVQSHRVDCPALRLSGAYGLSAGGYAVCSQSCLTSIAFERRHSGPSPGGKALRRFPSPRLSSRRAPYAPLCSVRSRLRRSRLRPLRRPLCTFTSSDGRFFPSLRATPQPQVATPARDVRLRHRIHRVLTFCSSLLFLG